MSGLDKVIALSGLAQAFYNRWRLRYIIPGAILIAGLTMVTSVMICVTLVGGLYAGYAALLYYGVEPEHAELIVSTLLLLVTLVLMGMLAKCLRFVRELPQTVWKRSAASSVAAEAEEVVNAFLDGLLAE